jgi:hypothetical protein
MRLGAPALVAGLLTAGCELTDTVAPTLESRVVVHAVLNPLSTQQIVLVEKTLRSLTFEPGQQAPRARRHHRRACRRVRPTRGLIGGCRGPGGCRCLPVAERHDSRRVGGDGGA